MAGEIRTSVIIDLAGNLAARARQFTQGMQRFGAEGSRSMQILRNATRKGGEALDSMGNRYAALLTGAAGAGSARMVANLNERLTRLGITADIDDAALGRLKKRVFEVAQAADVRVAPDQLLDAIDNIVEKTGDLKFAEENLRNIGIAIRASGGSGKDIGELLGEFQKIGLTGAKEVLEVFDMLNIQGKEGAFTLQNLAGLGPRVIQAYVSTGRKGAQAMREMGAALQLIRMGTGSSEMAATAFEELVNTLGDPAKIKMLQAGGIKVFDAEEMKKGREVLRPINELMVEIIKRAGGRKSVIGTIFDARAVRAFNVALAEFQRTGRVDTMGKFMRMQGDGTATLNDSARAAKTAGAAMTNLATAWERFADDNLTGPIQDLADGLNSLEPGAVQNWIKIGAGVAGVVGGLVLARKLYNVGRGIADIFRVPGKGGPGAPGGGLPGAPGAPIPVWVVNMGAMPGGAPGGGLPVPVPGGGGKGGLYRAGILAARALNVTAAGAVGYGVGSLLAQGIDAALSKIAGREASLGTMLHELMNKDVDLKGTIKIEIGGDGVARVAGARSNHDGMELEFYNGPIMGGA